MKNKQLMGIALKVLTPKELKIFRQMNTQYLVPFIKGRPGVGKSMVLKALADKLDTELRKVGSYMKYWDLRTPTLEETDAGLFPIPRDTKVTIDGKEQVIPQLQYAAPQWAVEPMREDGGYHLFAVEEINRAPLSIRNAFMGVLLERRVGWNINFRENVFMAATGNLGTVDGTEVDELDFAQKDRFITQEMKCDLYEWEKDYATGRVHPVIINFLKNHPGKFYPDMKEQDDEAVVTPRKWVGFSDFIIANTEKGIDSKVEDFLDLIRESGRHFLGKGYNEFEKFTLEGRQLTAHEVLSSKRNYGATWGNGTPKINRDNKAEVLTELKDGFKSGAFDINNMTQAQCENLDHFLAHMKKTDHDMLVGFVYDAFYMNADKTKDLSKEDTLKIPFIGLLWGKYRKEIDYVRNNQKEDPDKKKEKKANGAKVLRSEIEFVVLSVTTECLLMIK
jgi:hypothetical protein